jgi:anti-sigma-K factor RskA
MMHEEFDSLAALDAAGAATPAEEQALRAHLETCNDCSRARAEYGEAAALLARDLDPIAPPPEVRSRILAAVAPAESRPEQEDDDVVSPFFDPRWLATAAAIFLALWGWRELGIRAAREKIISQQAEIRAQKHQYDLLDAKAEKLTAEIEALASVDTRTIALTGQPMAPSASARVFLEPNARRAVVFFYNLPLNPNDKSYQLWIIRADQPKPQSAGTFDMTDSGRASIVIEDLPLATEIKALAVTLEPRGGATQPTNSNFYLMGQS